MIQRHAGRSVVIFGSIPRQIFDVFLRSFWTVILPYFDAISIHFFTQLSVQSKFISCNFHVCKLENADMKNFNALRF